MSRILECGLLMDALFEDWFLKQCDFIESKMKIIEQSFSETGKLPCLAKTKECENKNITVTCNNMRMKIL